MCPPCGTDSRIPQVPNCCVTLVFSGKWVERPSFNKTPLWALSTVFLYLQRFKPWSQRALLTATTEPIYSQGSIAATADSPHCVGSAIIGIRIAESLVSVVAEGFGTSLPIQSNPTLVPVQLVFGSYAAPSERAISSTSNQDFYRAACSPFGNVWSLQPSHNYR